MSCMAPHWVRTAHLLFSKCNASRRGRCAIAAGSSTSALPLRSSSVKFASADTTAGSSVAIWLPASSSTVSSGSAAATLGRRRSWLYFKRSTRSRLSSDSSSGRLVRLLLRWWGRPWARARGNVAAAAWRRSAPCMQRCVKALPVRTAAVLNPVQTWLSNECTPGQLQLDDVGVVPLDQFGKPSRQVRHARIAAPRAREFAWRGAGGVAALLDTAACSGSPHFMPIGSRTYVHPMRAQLSLTWARAAELDQVKQPLTRH